MRLLLVDSYDSFTHNLVQAFRGLGADVHVVQSDRIDVCGIRAIAPDALVLGPGPGRPEESGCLVDAVRMVAPTVPTLGVCLGHQAIGLAFGGSVVRHSVVHGHATPVHHDGSGVFRGLPPGVEMTRYHSLVVDPLPACLRVTARSDDGAVQGLVHRTLPIHGVQFHPESVLSGAAGTQLLANFLEFAAMRRPAPRSTAAVFPATV